MGRDLPVFLYGVIVGMLIVSIMKYDVIFSAQGNAKLGRPFSELELGYLLDHHVSEARIINEFVEKSCVPFKVDSASTATLVEAGASPLFIEALRVAKPCAP